MSTADKVAVRMLAIFLALMVAVFVGFSPLTLAVWFLGLVSLFVLSLFYFYFVAAGNE